MRTSICASFILLLSGTVLQVDASSQNRRTVVVSPRVGVVIDSLEATTYKLFPNIKNLHSVTFYQAPDSTLWAESMLKSTEDILHDSVFAISFDLLVAYAERIDHWEELLQNTYHIGTSQAHILYGDGNRLILPSFAFTTSDVSPRHAPPGNLPLARDTSGLLRPKFATIGFNVGLGITLRDLSELEQFGGNATNVAFPMSLYIQIPISEDPSLCFIGGWSYVTGDEGKVISFSSFLLHRTRVFSFLRPIAGLGAGHTVYDHSGQVIVNASQSYLILLLGLNIVPDRLDILLTYPLAKDLTTTFESKSYTIRPAGLGLGLLLSL